MKKVIIPNDCIRPEYAPYLFNYGEWNYFIYSYANSNPQFKLQDKHSEEWIELCMQLKNDLENTEKEVEYFRALKNQKISKVKTLSQKRLQNHMLEYIKDELCEFENDLRALYGIPGKSIKSEIDLNFITEKINEAEQECKKLNGDQKKGKPVGLLMITSHMCIQSIADLLRIDEMILSNQDLNIDDILLSHAQYRFIYDFLLFFGLLGSEIDNINTTTQKEDIIKQRHKNFPKGTNPKLYEVLMKNKIRIKEKIKEGKHVVDIENFIINQQKKGKINQKY